MTKKTTKKPESLKKYVNRVVYGKKVKPINDVEKALDLWAGLIGSQIKAFIKLERALDEALKKIKSN